MVKSRHPSKIKPRVSIHEGPPTILIASRSRRVLRRWHQAVADKFVVGEVKHWTVLSRHVASVKPGVLLLDTALPGYAGPPSLRALQRVSRHTNIVLLTDAPDKQDAIAALQVGARGFCRRLVARSLMLRVAEKVREGEIWITRTLVSRLLDEAMATRRKSNGVRPDLQQLTRRERQIALLVSEGYANRAIASSLKTAEKTVKGHLTRMFRKLGIPNRLHLALLVARRHRLPERPTTT